MTREEKIMNDNIELKLGEIRHEQDNFKSELNHMKEGIDGIKSDMKEDMKGIRTDLSNLTSIIQTQIIHDQKITHLEQSHCDISERLKQTGDCRVESSSRNVKIDNLEKDISKVEADIIIQKANMFKMAIVVFSAIVTAIVGVVFLGK